MKMERSLNVKILNTDVNYLLIFSIKVIFNMVNELSRRQHGA